MDKRSVSIVGVVLASGMSRRMGTSKQLLPYHGKSLVEQVIKKLLLQPIAKIVAVVGHRSQEIMDSIHIEDSRFCWKVNDQYRVGQSAALQCAADSVQQEDGMIVMLADQPLLKVETIGRVIDYAAERLSNGEDGFVVQPSYLGETGHPVFFSRSLLPSFGMLEGDEGGKRIIKLATAHYRIPVQDHGIHFDIDTPADYQKLIQCEGALP